MKPALVPFDITDLRPEKGSPAPERIVKGRPQSRSWNLYSSEDGKFFSCIWESDPGEWIVRYTEDEFCHILEGVSIIRSDDGTSMTVRAGDAFVIPAGFSGSWEVVERTRKHYAIYEA